MKFLRIWFSIISWLYLAIAIPSVSRLCLAMNSSILLVHMYCEWFRLFNSLQVLLAYVIDYIYADLYAFSKSLGTVAPSKGNFDKRHQTEILYHQCQETAGMRWLCGLIYQAQRLGVIFMPVYSGTTCAWHAVFISAFIISDNGIAKFAVSCSFCRWNVQRRR